jgi:hypothetical protein
VSRMKYEFHVSLLVLIRAVGSEEGMRLLWRD